MTRLVAVDENFQPIDQSGQKQADISSKLVPADESFLPTPGQSQKKSDAEQFQTVEQQLFSLPEFGSSDGISEIFGDGEGFLDGQLGGDSESPFNLFKDAVAQSVTFNPKARVDGIEKRFPNLVVERFQNGENAFITNPQNGKRAVVNKKGVSPQDLAPFVTTALPGFGQAKFISGGKTLLSQSGRAGLAAGGADALFQGAEILQGSDQGFDPVRSGTSVALGSGSNAALSKLNSAIDNRVANQLVQEAAPTTNQISATQQRLYREIDDSGITITSPSLQNFADRVGEVTQEEIIDPAIHSQTSSIIRSLNERASSGREISFSELEQIRSKLTQVRPDATGSNAPDVRMAGIVKDNLDSFVSNLNSSNISAGRANLDKAKSLVTQARGETVKRKKSELLQNAIDISSESSSGNLSDNIRKSFNDLSKEIISGKHKFFSKEEAKIISNIGKGKSSNIASAFRIVGNTGIGSGGRGLTASDFAIAASVGLNAVSVEFIVAQQGIAALSRTLAGRIAMRDAKFSTALARFDGDANKIARYYVSTVPKSQRSSEELAQIIAGSGGDITKLNKPSKIASEDFRSLITDTLENSRRYSGSQVFAGFGESLSSDQDRVE